jgi:hypothetical protein
MSEHNFEVESGKSIKLLTKNKVCTEDIVVSGVGGSGGGEELFNTYLKMELTNFVVPKEAPKVRSYLFYKDTGIKTADLRNATSIGSEAFRDSSLEEVIFDDNFNSFGKVYFGARSFYNTQLVDVSSTIDIGVSSGSPSIFESCLKLKNVYLPNVKFTGALKVFYGCSTLETVVINGGTNISNQNFLNCSSLTTLVLLKNDGVPTLSNINNFTGTPIESGTGYIYVPKALIEEYKVATNWVTYASQFRAIEDYPEICGGAD